MMVCCLVRNDSPSSLSLSLSLFPTISPPTRALGGELFRVIAVDPLPEVKARDVVFQILEGVCHLHTLNIIHMDLKVCNDIHSMYVCIGIDPSIIVSD